LTCGEISLNALNLKSARNKESLDNAVLVDFSENHQIPVTSKSDGYQVAPTFSINQNQR